MIVRPVSKFVLDNKKKKKMPLKEKKMQEQLKY